MQEFDDDDFGDLYTDVEVQASSAINCTQVLTPLPLDHENSDSSEADKGVGGGDGGNNGEEEEEKEDEEEEEEEAAVALEGQDWNGLENEVESESDSESEDDLNIVLNDDEDGNYNKVNNGGKLRFQIGRNVGRFDHENELGVNVEDTGNNGMQNDDGSGGHGGDGGGSNVGGYNAHYKRIRSQSAACSSNLNSNGSAGVAFYSSMFVRGNWEDNGCTDCVGTNSMGNKSGHYFSLPRSRTILDVNIDALEWKPWRHPGADLMDFFNFGLDEHSWKCYCNRLDRYRRQATKVKDNQAYKPWKHSKQHEVGCVREVSLEPAMENITPTKQRMAVSPSNEISHREQQLEMPKGIAIQVKDSIAERRPSIDIKHPVERDSDVIIQIPVEDMEEEVLTSEKVTFSQGTSHVHGASDCGELGDDSASDGEMLCFSSDSDDGPSIFEGPIEKAGISNPERCFKHTSGCDCNPVSWGSDNCGSLQVSDADKEHHEELADGNSEIAEAVRSSDDTQKSVGSVEPITASSTKESESYHGKESQHGPSSSPTRNHDLKSRDGTYVEHVVPDKFHGRLVRASPNSVSEVVESVTFDYCSSKDSRSHSIKMKSGDYKYLARSRSPIRRNLKFHGRKSSRVSDLQCHIDYKDAFSLFDSDKFHDIHHSTFGHHDQRNRHHGFDFSGRHDFSHYQGAEYSLCCGGKKYCDNLPNSAYAGNSHRSGLRVSEYERGQLYSQNINGKRHFAEQRMSRSSHYVMERDWDHYEGGDTVCGLESLDIKGPREFVSEQSQLLNSRNHTRWNRKSLKLNFRRRMKNDYFIPEYNYSNKLTQENCRSFNCNATEINRLQHKHDGQLLCGRKEDKILLRSKRRYESFLNGCETILCRDCEVEKSRYNRDQLSSWSYKEPRTVGRGREPDYPLSRIDIFENCSGQGRHNCFERYSSSCKFGSGAGVFDCDENMKNPDDQDNFARRRLYRQSEILQRREEEYSSWYPDDNFQAGCRSYPFNRTSRCKRSNAKNGSGYGGKLLDLSESEKCRYKLSREGNKGGQCLENSNVTCWDDVQRTLPSSQDSTEKHVWDRKSSRCSRAASLNGFHLEYEYLDWKDDPEQRTFKDLNGSHLEKVVRAENASPDIEEGEIATERFNEKPMERISSFKARTNITGTKNLSSENPRILEIIAKMEKRRERFKEPISLKIVSEKDGKPFADKVAETVETKKAQRPARKRKWVGN